MLDPCRTTPCIETQKETNVFYPQLTQWPSPLQSSHCLSSVFPLEVPRAVNQSTISSCNRYMSFHLSAALSLRRYASSSFNRFRLFAEPSFHLFPAVSSALVTSILDSRRFTVSPLDNYHLFPFDRFTFPSFRCRFTRCHCNAWPPYYSAR